MTKSPIRLSLLGILSLALLFTGCMNQDPQIVCVDVQKVLTDSKAAKEDVRCTGLPNSTEIETQMMDYFTWQGGVGLEFGNDNMSVGVNYTLQAGQNSTGHGVFGMFRYEF